MPLMPRFARAAMTVRTMRTMPDGGSAVRRPPRCADSFDVRAVVQIHASRHVGVLMFAPRDNQYVRRRYDPRDATPHASPRRIFFDA